MSKQNLNKGKLYLIPVEIASHTASRVLPATVFNVINRLGYFMVENKRSARRFISSLDLGINIEDLNFEIFDKKTTRKDLESLLKPLFDGVDAGILSEAGTPGIADPGNLAVHFAHEHDIQVAPLVGPSSIMLGLMGSGLNGQHFSFHGYLPIKDPQRKQKIQQLEKNAAHTGATQIFMETPYRNNQLLEDLLIYLQKNTLLCVASNLTGENEWIKTKKILEWRQNKPNLNKIPTIFLLNV